MDATAILQRTSTGLETIKTKSVRLTQSERLILIMVNGVTPYTALREKVWALSTERFTRALNTLLDKDLIFEVLLPDESRQPDELDSSLVDQFLQQDVLDPVTIISMDPEDHFGIDLIAQMGHAPPAQAGEPVAKIQTRPALADAPGAVPMVQPPLALETSKAKSLPASAPRANPDSIKTAADPEPSPVLEKNQKSSADVHARGMVAAPGPAKQPALPREPVSAPPATGRRDAIPGSSTKSGSRTSSQHLPYASSARKSKKQPVDFLKLCSWTGLLTGFGIFLFLLFQYYRTIA